jgi:PAS domain S-box-containing protein
MSLLFNSLRTRLLALVILSALPALALVAFSGWELRKQAAEDVQNDSLRVARLAATRHQALVDGTRRMLITLAQVEAVHSGSPDECSAFLRHLIASYPEYSSLSVANRQGVVYCYSHPSLAGVDVSQEPYFQNALERQVFGVGEYITGVVAQSTILPLAYPQYDAQGSVQGVLIAALNLNWVSDLAAEIELPERAALLIVAQNGQVLARQPEPEEWVGRILTDSPLVQEMLDVQGEGAVEVSGIDGVVRLYALSPLYPAVGDTATIGVGIPTEVAYQNIDRNVQRNLILLSIVALIGIGAAWVISDVFVLRQLRGFTTAIRRLANGELAGKHQPSGMFEVDQMGEAFDQMADNLHRRETQLRQAQERYQTLVEQVPAVIYTEAVDNRGQMLYVSPQIEKLLGYSPDEWLATPELWMQRLHRLDRARIEEKMTRMPDEGDGMHIEYRLLNKRGRPVWVRDESRLICDERGQPVLIQGILTDITDRVRAELSLKAYTIQLERSNRELEDFAYIASHDLQEPLRKIQAFGERLEVKYKAALGEDGQMYVDRMTSSAGRLQNLINDLLSYSRVSTRTRPFEPVNLNEVIREAMQGLEERLAETRGQVEVEPLPEISADRVQMRQLFQNLIANALKFHKPGFSPQVHISGEIIRTREGSKVQIKVADSGIGFDEKYLERIFLPFQRLHGRLEYDGSGIGLAICRKIAERHNGHITAKSAPDAGATFIITLPVDHVEDEKEN